MSGQTGMRLQDIPVAVEQSSGNVAPLLHEIRHGLAQLLSCGTDSAIDLLALPLAPGEEARILALLGAGEVRAEITSLGRSEITETAYPGVWLTSHYNEQGALQARFIEITRFPAILASQDEDILAASRRLADRLSGPDPTGAP